MCIKFCFYDVYKIFVIYCDNYTDDRLNELKSLMLSLLIIYKVNYYK